MKGTCFFYYLLNSKRVNWTLGLWERGACPCNWDSFLAPCSRPASGPRFVCMLTDAQLTLLPTYLLGSSVHVTPTETRLLSHLLTLSSDLLLEPKSTCVFDTALSPDGHCVAPRDSTSVR